MLHHNAYIGKVDSGHASCDQIPPTKNLIKPCFGAIEGQVAKILIESNYQVVATILALLVYWLAL